ncbi:response regulator [Labilithrix luteola]|uniref:Response regulator n=1 Tax=Labilithrix luteola TaxID=1391654 RepID=A0A0K1Q024_9BACT|nr:response regulator [Labilithrix luteola]AKU99135.1 response regulator [Labilithrix luteola]
MARELRGAANAMAEQEKGSEPFKALILIADDDPDLVMVMDEALAYRGYRTVTANNGLEALDRIRAEVPQLVLLDMKMPVMDGWEFAKALREEHGRKIPIVVITAKEDLQLRADELGAEGDLGKPFDTTQLYEVVEDMLGLASPPNGAAPRSASPVPQRG